ncbi:DUF1624 domain-containing protein [Mucilaginibacter ginsenosidivorax]|uniref:DUF1624 domain-containing protein n=1 Tax=Mucilaginibacter ginsenosidivorax TaxID=862126 RepID=A0A5B8W403_9SPHI|nr:heparan-alpha-glucosaminide N-acetyltransferase domain-containing protein [Mucilaginibacter ginsenosidivorax]QEC78531.1 DUF1624 domain-containing protein [Mucilaginibacter ginsenosidivorax]
MEVSSSIENQRISAIDKLRGIIMVIMVLDHVRDYFTIARFDPLDLSKTTALLFMTRWVTHFCAPTFIFLSGISAFLSVSKRKNKKESCLFLVKRGVWLVLLELTLIGFGWQFDFGFHVLFIQVIWVIGWSMIILSFLTFLNARYIALFGLALIFGHNFLDGVHPAGISVYHLTWLFLHDVGIYKFNNYHSMFILYPLIPWLGVMCVGYAFGNIFKLEADLRKSIIIKTGLACLALFLILRFFNIYGDPHPWHIQLTWWKTILDFINCNKYPPSLLYLLMTLGVSVIALGCLEKISNKLTSVALVFGRVPLFFYILHIYLVHCTQLLIAFLTCYSLPDILKGPFRLPYASSWGFDLPFIYLIWLSIIILLYVPCRWFMNFKQKRKDWWLSYI